MKSKLHTSYLETQVKILRIRLNRIEKDQSITESVRHDRYDEVSNELFEVQEIIESRKGGQK